MTGYASKGLLAQQVARSIEDMIVTRALPPGAYLGREADMTVQLQISRPTLRAAIRFLEVSGTVKTRPGVRGGVFVAEQDTSAAVLVLARHIVALGQPLPVFLSVQMPFFAYAAGLAAINATPRQREELAALTAEMLAGEDTLAGFRPVRQQLRLILLQATGLASLELIGEALMRAYIKILEGELKLRDTEVDKVRIVKQAEASFLAPLVAGDRAATLAAFDAAAEQERSVTVQSIRAGMGPENALPHTLFAKSDDAPGASRLAEHVMRAIRRDIHFRYPAGQLIGSIADIAARYGVSQEICREALGLLSLHGLVIIRRGQGGGVFAGTLNLNHVGTVIDPALKACQGLPELAALLGDIRDALPGSTVQFHDTSATVAFLGELIDHVTMAMADSVT